MFEALRIGQKVDPATLMATQLWVVRVLALLQDIGKHGAQFHHRETARHLFSQAAELRLRKPGE